MTDCMVIYRSKKGLDEKRWLREDRWCSVGLMRGSFLQVGNYSCRWIVGIWQVRNPSQKGSGWFLVMISACFGCNQEAIGSKLLWKDYTSFSLPTVLSQKRQVARFGFHPLGGFPPPLFDQYFDRLLTQLIQPGLIRSWSIYWNVLDHDIGQEIILRSKLSSPQNRRWECCEWKEYSYHQAHFSSSNHPSTFPSHFFDS